MRWFAVHELIVTLVALGVASAPAQGKKAPSVPPSALAGQRVLLIMINGSSPETVWLAKGRAQLRGSLLEVVLDSSNVAVNVKDVDVLENAFEPAVLPHLVGEDEYLPLAEQLTQDVTRCIPMLVDKAPAGARAVPGFLGGLATMQDGKILLFQVR